MSGPPVTVVVGVDGSGRTHRLRELALGVAAANWLPPGAAGPALTETLAALAPAGSTAGVGTAAEAGRGVLIVDDAHLLPATSVRELLSAAAAGLPMIAARRPGIGLPELAALDALLAAAGRVELLGPLPLPVLAGLLGGSADPQAVARLQHRSGGWAAIAAALAPATEGEVPAALVARVQRRLALLDPAAAQLARLLAVAPHLPDEVLAAAAGIDLDRYALAVRTLREEGLLLADGEAMVPVVAEVLRADLPPAQLRRAHEAVASALLASGGDPVPAADQLRAARARTPTAAHAYRTAGERLRFADPAAALDWFDDAVEAGLDPGEVAAGRAEARVQLGMVPDLDPGTAPVPAPARERLRLVEGVLAAQQGRAGRAAELLLASGTLGRALAVPALVSIGRWGPAVDCAREAVEGHVPVAVRRLAEAALAVVDPEAAVPALIEAAEALDGGRPEVLLPDTAHALAARVAVTAGDAATAEHLLERAVAAELGGPAGIRRHLLLLAWVRMRAGRFDTAVAVLSGAGLPGLAPAGHSAAGPAGSGAGAGSLPGRDRLLRCALAAGIARRSGDIVQLRQAWAEAEHVLARQTVDLFELEPLEELLVAATRVRQPQRIVPVLAALEQAVEGLGRPPAWAMALGWLRFQLAIGTDDPRVPEPLVAEIAALPAGGSRQQAQQVAVRCWAGVLTGAVDAGAVTEVSDRLVAVQLPWEASRLVGQAAIRSSDPAAARRLLERARELSTAEAQAEEARGGAAPGGLSEREIEVAQLVLAGRTHREIGAQLFLSPKTVEHHVARIRTKLGASTRAEFLAALRSALGPA